MNKYIKEIIILFLQLLMFYVFPLFAGPTDIMGMVIIIWFVTMILGMFLFMISNKKVKYLYPLIVSILFIPSVFIYYNDSAFIHSLWYCISSFLGMLIGILVSLIKRKINL